MSLTEDGQINILKPGTHLVHDVKAGVALYQGKYAGYSTGARQLVAGDHFLGLVRAYVDNTDGLLGDKKVHLECPCTIENQAVAGVVAGNEGLEVYASDAETLTLTPGSNSRVGSVRKVRSAGYADVDLQPYSARADTALPIKFSGSVAWSGSGASKAATVAGVLATDIVVASIKTAPTQAAYLVSAAPTTDTITFVLSAANTGNDAVIHYVVTRPAA